MFIAALFTIAKLCNQSRCPTPNEWKKEEDIYDIWIYHVYLCICRKLLITIFSEKDQAQKAKYCVVSIFCGT
jgi:hypothetical protein